MILVTDGEQRSALAVVRSLGKAGYEVSVCSARARPLSGASRYCRAVHTTPDPAVDAQGFTEAVEGIVDREAVELVVPITDTSVPLLLGLRERRPEIAMPFPPLRTYDQVSDKLLLTRVARELDVPVPRQIVIDSPRAAAQAAVGASEHEMAWPLILKPARSAALAGDAVRRFGVRSVTGPESLAAEVDRSPPEAFPLLLQERIVGPGLGVFMLGDGEGRPLASFAHRRLREKPPAGGVSVYRESIPLRDGLREHAERIMTRFRWSGAIMLEFKEDAATGTPYLMEANARFWGSLQLAVDAGVDFPRLLVQSALGADVDPVHTYRSGVRSRWLWGDFDHLLGLLRMRATERAQYPSLPGRARAIARFLLPWHPGDRFEVLRWSDPRPFVRESVQWLQSLGS